MKIHIHSGHEVPQRKRSKETAKAELIRAVGKVLAFDGYLGLKVGNIARHAGYNRRLVQAYFGSLEGLIGGYIVSKEYWTPVFQNLAELTDTPTKNELQEFLTGAFSNLLNSLIADVEMQQLILWSISDPIPSLQTLEKPWQDQMNREVSVSNCKSEPDFRAFLALLYGGICTTVFAGRTGISMFGKLNVTNEQDLKEMHDTIGFLIGQATRDLGSPIL